MKTFQSAKSPSAPVPIELEKAGAERQDQSLFSLLLEIESRLRKEARTYSRPRIGPRNDPPQVSYRRRSRRNDLSRYVE